MEGMKREFSRDGGGGWGRTKEGNIFFWGGTVGFMDDCQFCPAFRATYLSVTTYWF